MLRHAKNTQFQYVSFIVGSCHTADKAYAVIQDQLEDRQQAILHADAAALRSRAKRIRIEEVFGDPKASAADKLEAEADLIQLDADDMMQQACYEEAEREVAFLEKLLEAINPHRRFRALPDHEAMQACQREEWFFELLERAENFLASNHTIPADHLAAMRQHPDFGEKILPRLSQLHEKAGKLQFRARPAFVGAIEAAVGMALPAADVKRRPMAIAAPADQNNASDKESN